MTAKRQYRIVGGAMMAAALVLGMTACSSENDLAGEPKTVEEPTQPQATKIHVTVGAGISDPTPDPGFAPPSLRSPIAPSSQLPTREGSSATTRSTVDYTGGTRTLQFTTGDKLWVRCEIGDAEGKILAGFLDIDAGSIASTTTGAGTPEEKTTEATSASFSGELKVYGRTPSSSEYGFDYTESSYDFGGAADVLAYCLSDLGEAKGAGSATATLVHSGTQAAFDNDGMHGDGGYARSTATDANALMVSRLAVSGDYDAASQAFLLTAEAGQPILNCTIAGLKAGATYTMTYSASIDDGTYREHTTGSVATDASGTAMFACFGGTRLYDGSQWVNNLYHRIRLTNAADAGDTYTVSLGQKVFEGKVYNVSRRFVDLSDASIYSDGGVGFIAQNGDILSGTMPTDQYRVIKIADGAKVTLHNVTIENSNYIGIDCDGSATINLEGTNTVSSGNDFGINCWGTLTIQGSGSLAATGGNGGAGIGGGTNSHVVIKGGTIVAQGGTGSTYSGAGIGGGGGGTFGNIRIEGGDVTATGGDNAAGIGCGYRQGGVTCGTITITGGTVRAAGGANAAGIGCGKGYEFSFPNVCGDITISGGTVEATAGTVDCSAIGEAGQFSYSGHIRIEGGDVTATNNSNQFPCIGNGYRKDPSVSSVTVTSGITRVAMTNSAAGNKISFFIDDGTVNIGTRNGVNTSLGVNSYNYGTVGSYWNSSTKTWTLTKK